MTLEEQIIAVRTRFNEWVIKSIEVCFEATKTNGGTTLTCFILISCGIDAIAGFYSGRNKIKPGSVGEEYKLFIERYMPLYEPETVYLYIRNALVHDYSLRGELGLTHDQSNLHQVKVVNISGMEKIINLNEFFKDFKKAVDSYFVELESSADLKYKFSRHLNFTGFAGIVDLKPENIVVAE